MWRKCVYVWDMWRYLLFDKKTDYLIILRIDSYEYLMLRSLRDTSGKYCSVICGNKYLLVWNKSLLWVIVTYDFIIFCFLKKVY